MKSLNTIFLITFLSGFINTTNAGPTPNTPGISERSDTIDITPRAGKQNGPNWFTVTEYASSSDICAGTVTAVQTSPYFNINPTPRSGCRDVQPGTTRIQWQSNFQQASGLASGYLVTFSQPGCMGPVMTTISADSDCFGKKNFYNTVASYEAWRSSNP